MFRKIVANLCVDARRLVSRTRGFNNNEVHCARLRNEDNHVVAERSGERLVHIDRKYYIEVYSRGSSHATRSATAAAATADNSRTILFGSVQESTNTPFSPSAITSFVEQYINVYLYIVGVREHRMCDERRNYLFYYYIKSAAMRAQLMRSLDWSTCFVCLLHAKDSMI